MEAARGVLAADPYRYGTKRCQNPEPHRRLGFWQRIRTVTALSAARNGSGHPRK